MIILDPTQTTLWPDRNLSGGIFVCSLTNMGGNEVVNEIQFIGNIEDFDNHLGRFPISSFTIPQAHQKLFLKVKFCNDNRNWQECWNSGVGGKCKPTELLECNSSDSDVFALRPEKFDLTIPSHNIIAGNNTNLIFKALDYSNSPTNNYNEAQNSSFNVRIVLKDSSKTCNTTALSIPQVNYTNGIDNKSVKFGDIGEFNISIFEINGSEFAKIDASDTPDTERLIKEYNSTLTIIPAKLGLSVTSYSEGGNGFTYLSNDMNMSCEINSTIKALSSDNNITKNYTKSCYAKDINYSIGSTLSAFFGQNIKILPDINNTIFSFPYSSLVTVPISKNIFSDSGKGEANISLKINFSRNVNETIPPFTFNITDLNVTDASGVKGNLHSTNSFYFYYGRLHIPDYEFEENQGEATAYYEVYSPNKTIDPANICGKESVDDIDWFVNTHHNSNQNGKINSINTIGSVAATVLPSILNGTEKISFTYNGTFFPYRDRAEVNSSSWLIYNRLNSTKQTTSFFVNFIKSNPAGWAGKRGNTGKTLDINLSKKRDRWINW